MESFTKNSNGVKILSISGDRKIFEEGSAVRARMIEYGKKVGQLHIVVFTTKEFTFHDKKIKQGEYEKIADNVFVYPTQSLSRWFYVLDGASIGKKIIFDQSFVRGESVITCQDPFECGFAGWSIAERYRLPLHLQIHTDFLSPYFKTSFLQRLRVICAKFLLPRASGIRVVSERIKRSLVASGISLKAEVIVLPIRIDLESIEKFQKINIQTMFPQFTYTILMASRLTKEKRISDALSAFASVCTQYPSAGLFIAGTGPEKESLEALAIQLGIQNNVVFLGFRDDIPSLLKSVNMFLSTSEFEGYGMSLVEAGLSLCPIVSTDVGVAGEILKDGLNAYVCPVGDQRCFASKMAALISDSATRGIFTGRLYSDIRSSIPEKEKYISDFIQGITDCKEKI